MKVIKSDSGFLAFQKIFKKIQSGFSEILLWQVSPTTGERNLIDTHLTSFYLEAGTLHFKKNLDIELDPLLPIYFYCKDVSMIFKTKIHNSKDSSLALMIPEEIQMLEEEEVQEFTKRMGANISTHWGNRTAQIRDEIQTKAVTLKHMHERSQRDQDFLNNEFGEVSVDEEDKLFANKRESPRSRPKVDKWVKVRVEGDDGINFHRLFDLSRGGMSFLVTNPEGFPKGKMIHIMGFEEFDLDDPLVGQIMSQRSVDSSQVEFKIGIKFNEGQD